MGTSQDPSTKIKYTLADLKAAQRWWRFKDALKVWLKLGGAIAFVIGSLMYFAWRFS